MDPLHPGQESRSHSCCCQMDHLWTMILLTWRFHWVLSSSTPCPSTSSWVLCFALWVWIQGHGLTPHCPQIQVRYYLVWLQTRALCFGFTWAQTWHLAEVSHTRLSSLGKTYLDLSNSETFVDLRWIVWWKSVIRVLPVDFGRMIFPFGILHHPVGLSSPFLLYHGISGSTESRVCYQKFVINTLLSSQVSGLAVDDSNL